MFKKLCMLLIFSKLKVQKLLIDKYRMHNLYAIFAKLLNICKQIADSLVNEFGNVPRRGIVPKFSDFEVVALNMASEAVGIDSESLLFAKLQDYRLKYPTLFPADNTMTDVKSLPPYVMQSEKEWFLKWMVVKTISVLIRKHSNKCTFYTLRFGCSFAVANTIKPQLL